MSKEKTNIPLSKEEIALIVNKVAQHENVDVALKVRDGEERIKIIEKLQKHLPKEKQE